MHARRELARQAARLRSQVLEGRYVEALEALDAYGRAVRAAALTFDPDDPGLRELEESTGRLIEDLERRAQAGRAQAAARLERLPALPSILDRAPQTGRTWQIMA